MAAPAKALDLDAVRAFVLTADLQSFTRAALALDSTQSAVSLKLRRLEDHLGRRLLERTPRRVHLSVEGAAFLDAARDLLKAHEHAVAAFETEPRRLVIGLSQLIVGSELPSLLRRLYEHDPALLIELRVAGSRELATAYDEHSLDAIVVLEPEERRHTGDVLFMENFGWFAAPDWQPRAGQPIPLATQGESCSLRAAAVRALDSAGIAWTEVFIGKGSAVVGAAATAGLAVAVLARRSAPSRTIDVAASLRLPPLPVQQVVLHTVLRDARSRTALRALAVALEAQR